MNDNAPTNSEPIPDAPVPPAPAPRPRSGLALAALIVGIAAMLFAIIPFLSFVAFVPAFTAVGLGIAALVKKSGKGKALTGLTLGGLAFFVAISVSAATIGGLAGAGSVDKVPLVNDDTPATATSEPASNEPSEEAEAPAPTVPADKVYSGSGDSVIPIELPDGPGQVAVATISHTGSSNFTVWSLDSGMEEQDLMVNVIGNYAGTVLFNARGNDTTSLEIGADGAWTVTVRSILSLREFTGATASGAGDDVVIYRGQAGVATITHDGSSNFTVWSYGERTDLVVNEIGAYSGGVRWTAGPSLVAISADGNWSIAVG